MPKVMCGGSCVPCPTRRTNAVPAGTPATNLQRCALAAAYPAQGQLSGPCSLCGSKRSTSCWRPLPEYTGNRAGQPACEWQQRTCGACA